MKIAQSSLVLLQQKGESVATKKYHLKQYTHIYGHVMNSLTESLLPQKINLDDIFETIYHCKKITEK
jgi:hypothetical protein